MLIGRLIAVCCGAFISGCFSVTQLKSLWGFLMLFLSGKQRCAAISKFIFKQWRRTGQPVGQETWATEQEHAQRTAKHSLLNSLCLSEFQLHREVSYNTVPFHKSHLLLARYICYDLAKKGEKKSWRVCKIKLSDRSPAVLMGYLETESRPASGSLEYVRLKLQTKQQREAVGCLSTGMTSQTDGAALFIQQTTKFVRWLDRSNSIGGQRRRSTTCRCHRSANVPFKPRLYRRRRTGFAFLVQNPEELWRFSEPDDIPLPSPFLQWIFFLWLRLIAKLPALPEASDVWQSDTDPEPHRTGANTRPAAHGWGARWRTGHATRWAQTLHV